MKKLILITIGILAAATCRAQFCGELSVTRRQLCQRGDSLYMDLRIEVSRLAVPASQSWSIVPELSTPDRNAVKLFPHVQINGRYQQQMYLRRRLLSGRFWTERQPYALVDASGKEDVFIDYRIAVPYEEWMNGATLTIRQVLTTADRKRRIFSVDVNGAVDHE